RRQSLEDRLRVAFKGVAVNPYPFFDVLAAPEVRLATGLVFDHELAPVDRNRPCKARVEVGRADERRRTHEADQRWRHMVISPFVGLKLQVPADAATALFDRADRA